MSAGAVSAPAVVANPTPGAALAAIGLVTDPAALGGPVRPTLEHLPSAPAVSLEALHPATVAKFLERRSGGHAPMGFNAPKVLRYETTGEAKWGTLDALLTDLVDAGGQYIRQPTDADLCWPTGEGVDVPVEPLTTRSTGEAEAGPVYVALRSALWDRLYASFARLGTGGADDGAAPLRLVLTFPTLGHIGQVSVTDPIDDMSGKAPEIVDGKMLSMGWDMDPTSGHPAQSLTWWDGTTVRLEDSGYSEADPSGISVDYGVTRGNPTYWWIQSTLDPRSRYKLYYLYLMGRAAAQLLLDLDAAFQAETRAPEEVPEWGGRASVPSVFGRLIAIELGNELDKSLICSSGEVSTQGRYHALMVREVTRGLQQVFGDHGRRLLLLLPSLSQYFALPDDKSGAGSGPPTFEDTLAFDRALLQGLADTAGEFGDDPAVPPVDLSWLQYQDYHYYHFDDSTAPGPIMRLVQEVQRLEALMGEVTDPDGVAPFAGVRVTVSETGASAAVSQAPIEAYPYLGEFFDSHPTPAAQSAAVAQLQAREVWRRMAVALCTAAAAGWNSHMSLSGAGNNFVGSGIREDLGDDSTQTAAEAHTRLSWWAWQRLNQATSAYGGGQRDDINGARGRLAYGPAVPLVDGVEATYDDLDPSDAEQMAVIVEFVSTVLADYAYVLFLDPMADTAAEAEVIVSNPSGGRVVQLPTIPEALTDGSAADATSFPDDSPDSAWDTPLVDTEDVELRLSLVADQDPILLLSAYPLEFTVQGVV